MNPSQCRAPISRAQTSAVARTRSKSPPSRSKSPTRSKSPFSRKAFHQDDIRRQISGKGERKTKKRRPFSSFAPVSAEGDDENLAMPEPGKGRATSAKVTRQPSARNVAITKAVRETRAMTSTNVKRSQMTPEQAWLMTQPTSQKKQQFKGNIMELNAIKVDRVENKMRDFLSKYPIISKS